ncbi:double-stranded RNA-specific editase B2-like isoform X2 [Pollicipes pollicipes]|nr:double-stranded RNA-specific editase B2-like isoform X2 [Pollicipes pollicipes]XP_037088613.1 double-stranded RNA-specific editase B2-like isoform X2 [Pollicipes pollicipes]
MSTRSTRNSVRTSPAAQPLNKSFVSGGQVAPPSQVPVVTYSTTEQPPAAMAATAVPKQEQPAADDVNMAEAPAAVAPAADGEGAKNGDKVARMPWMKVQKAPGARRKPNKQLIQRRLRKHLTPKNATVALQEIQPGVTYQFSAMPGSAPGVFTAEVEVGGKKFHGVGSNKSLARAAAAELALQSFVKPPTRTKDEQGHDVVQDDTPWGALASFALHKLFCDWRRGVVGAPLSVQGAALPAVAASCAASAAAAAKFTSDAPGGATFQSFSVPPMDPPPGPGEPPKKVGCKKPKALPEDAAKRHPVQLLHEMKARVHYETLEHNMPKPGTQETSFTVAAFVDEQSWQASARTKKLAKYEAAKKAMTALYGVAYE